MESEHHLSEMGNPDLSGFLHFNLTKSGTQRRHSDGKVWPAQTLCAFSFEVLLLYIYRCQKKAELQMWDIKTEDFVFTAGMI